MDSDNNPLAGITIPTQGGPVNINIKAGCPLFILGRNGTGKSALLNYLAGNWRGQYVYLPGSRPSYFDHESLSMTPASRRDFGTNTPYFNSVEARWKATAGTARNEKAIHDLQAAEIQYKLDAANQIKQEGVNSSAIARLQADNSPLDIVNTVLSQANLSVQIEVVSGELRARQGAAIYSYARMSDGERSALVFSAEVVSAPPKTVFLIDEPELHLHPSILISLIKSLIVTRPDCAFLICTHELNLPIAVQSCEIVLVRGSTWRGSDIVLWDFDLIQEPQRIPEWLWDDVVGARRRVLFIEGNSTTSLDQPLYSLLFPEISVSTLGTCKDVARAVEGLRAVEDAHRTMAFGLIDHDGMSEEQIADFERKGIYPLPIFSVESIVYSDEAQLAVASLQSEVLGIPSQQLLDEAKNIAMDSLNQGKHKEHLAGRLAERQIRDQILSSIPRRQQLMESADKVFFEFASPYLAELARLEEFVALGKLQEIISRYPVRESGVLNCIARGLRFNSRDDYERAVLRRVHADSNLRGSLKQKLGKLSVELE